MSITTPPPEAAVRDLVTNGTLTAAQADATAGPHWEVYYTDPNVQPDPTRWRTDVVQPYRTA